MYPPPHAYSPTPAPPRRWWQHPALIITMLFFLPPVGIALAWTSRWSQTKKIVATVLSGIWFLIPLLSDPPKKTDTDAKPQALATAPSTSPRPSPSAPPSFVGQSLKAAKKAASTAGYNATSHDAADTNTSQWDDDNWKVCFQTPAAKQIGKLPTLDFGVVRNEVPCPANDGEPIPYPKMPKVVGQTFAKASEALKPIGLQKIEPQSAYTDVTLPGAVDDWVVCFQEPAENKELQTPKTTTAYLQLAAPGTACPSSQHTELHPKPAPAPNDDDSHNSSTGGSTSTTGGSGGGSGSGGSGGGSVYYKNCTAARAAGAAPVHRGDPGYGRHLDRDGDGVGCE